MRESDAPRDHSLVLMDKSMGGGRGPRELSNEQNGAAPSDQEGTTSFQALESIPGPVLPNPAKVIEETGHQLTDVLTAISGRIEILSDKIPEIYRDELLAIRKVVLSADELNQRMLRAVRKGR